MSIRSQEFMRLGLAFSGIRLLQTDGELADFQDVVGTDVVVGAVFAPSNPQDREATQQFLIPRDRIRVDVNPAGSAITREYPDEDDLGHLAEIARQVIEISGKAQSPQAFGYNIEVVYDNDGNVPAGEYLSRRFFEHTIPRPNGWSQFSGWLTLGFREGETVWNVTLEPRFRDANTTKVYLGINWHHGEQRYPDVQEIVESLHKIWDEAIAYALQIDDWAPG